MPICVAAGGLVLAIATQAFTLAWTHSIEKVRWEEDYRAERGRLHLTEARIRGHGAGMEPPPDSRLEGGVWHYAPALPPLPELRLTHSSFAAGYEICHAGFCEPLTRYAPRVADGEPIIVTACAGAP